MRDREGQWEGEVEVETGGGTWGGRGVWRDTREVEDGTGKERETGRETVGGGVRERCRERGDRGRWKNGQVERDRGDRWR